MKKYTIKFSFLCATAVLLMNFSGKEEVASKPQIKAKKSYCCWIRCDGKNWYELSPLAVSPNNAVDLVKERYPKCKVTRASDGSCD